MAMVTSNFGWGAGLLPSLDPVATAGTILLDLQGNAAKN